MNILEINKTEKAKKKITKIARNNALDFEFVYQILSFYWNYDGDEGAWVKNVETDNEYNKRQENIRIKLNLANEEISKNNAVETILIELKETNKNELENKFLYGAQYGNYCSVSEYASFHYLNNGNTDKLNTLNWKTEKINNKEIIRNIFYKIFRGGSIERYNLEYLYADLIIKLPYNNVEINTNNWLKEFEKDIKANNLKLSDLIVKLKQYCKGDKHYLQTILEALSYSGIIKVKNYGIENKFIPDYRNELSKHYYSNEWTFPLRFWNER
jgi:hypothetical protein